MKNTLVAVSGMSPAIITETLWALALEPRSVVPDEVIVITTSKGEQDIHDLLLTAHKDWRGKTVWDCLRAHIFSRTGQPKKSAGLQLSVKVIDLPDVETGVRRKAEDLRTKAHNDQAADFIVRTLAPYVDAEDNHVIASIAGGRKTMGALLYASMSLIGKETDRVTHVLVSEPFENCKGFFYPEQPVQSLEARPFGRPPVVVMARDAHVEMADVAFVPLRNRFDELKEPRRTFAGLVERYARAQKGDLKRPPKVSIDVDKETLTVEGRPIALTGRDLIIAYFLHERALEGKDHFRDRSEAKGELQTYLDTWKKEHPTHRAPNRLSGALSEDDLTKALASLRKKLQIAGLKGAICHLTPARKRIGFDLRLG